MKLTKEEFKKLQSHWYKLLEESGFQDIEKLERGELVLKQAASYCYRATDAFGRAMKEEYFATVAKWAQDEETIFRSEVDRYILTRHAEGARAIDIVHELSLRGTPMHRHSIRFIIRRYEMSWGLKSYGPKELNVKK